MTEIFNEESNDTMEIDSNSFTVISYVNSLTFILTVIFIAGMILNTISIAAIFKSKKFEPINILILNLAFADLIYTLGIPLFTAHIFSMNWSFGLIGCRVSIKLENKIKFNIVKICNILVLFSN